MASNMNVKFLYSANTFYPIYFNKFKFISDVDLIIFG